MPVFAELRVLNNRDWWSQGPLMLEVVAALKQLYTIETYKRKHILFATLDVSYP